MKKIILFLMAIATFPSFPALSQSQPMVIPLYPGKIPNEVPGPDQEKSSRPQQYNGILIIEKIRKPTLSIYLPDPAKANGTAVVVIPGGGYGIVAAGHEGEDVARKFNEQGIAAFVLKYRLPDAQITSKPEITPLQDAQQAIYLVRKRAAEWKINPSRVGILGFSAGGHLASTAGTHSNRNQLPESGNISLRPDFMLLIYPVISSNPEIAHAGSFQNLLGKNAVADKLKLYSNEQQVTAQTPPTFLMRASDDEVVKAENSIVFYQALLRNKVKAELHLYQAGGHGFGLENKTTPDYWFDRGLNWLRANGWLATK